MANLEKLMPANVTIWAAYPEAFADITAITAAELNNAQMVFNISCAIEEGYTLAQTSSDTDDSRTICDEGEVTNPTFFNYEASLDTFRTHTLTESGVFNLAYHLFKHKGVPFVLVQRIGYKNNVPAAPGQILSLVVGVETDNPVDIVDDVTNIQHGARFKPTGDFAQNVEVL